MKKKILKLCVIFLILPCLLIGGCSKLNNNGIINGGNSGSEDSNTGGGSYTPPTSGRFGEYGYNGQYLRDYAVKEITVSEAKKIINANKTKSSVSTQASQGLFVSKYPKLSVLGKLDLEPSEEQLHTILDNYSICTVTVETFVGDGDYSGSPRQNELSGGDLQDMLKKNEYMPFSQMKAKIIFIYDGILEQMESHNKKFLESSNKDLAPFKKPYIYSKDSLGNLVLKIFDYSEMPSSESGGISSFYRQDIEICYDSEGKIKVWQTSLGLSIATPQGTVKQGYILKSNFAWTKKV